MGNTDKGYIKLYRGVREHWTWSTKPFSQGQAWIDIIMSAAYEDKTITFDGSPLNIRKGEFITSIAKLADRWGWSRGKVSRFLNNLENDHMINQNRTSKRTAIFVVNYSNFQDVRTGKRTSDGQLTDSRRTSDGHNEDINKDINKDIKRNMDSETYDPLAGVRKRYDDL